ncbi:AraC-type DNA-binding protein [Nocardioides sp. YR527]|uniref:AraC family transcriptional regulator n=1 Tax=Nocardioides sp. YR527 TaxID=1881028 RepID=UPI000890FF76|nr:AraC family transcriptional regulator [Nocardioides sp. YR527]SDJ78731.1 AraC-type DNA-binding protein [Nocardioides sp. YR527]
MSMEQLRSLIARHARRGSSTAAEGVLVSMVTSPGDPSAVSLSGTVFALIAQGRKTLTVGDRIHDYGPGEFLVTSLDLPVRGQYTEASVQHPALGFGLRLRPSVIAELLLDPGAEPIWRRSAEAAPALAVSTADDDLIDAAVRMLRLLDRPRDIQVLAPLVEREILWRLMTGEQGATVRQLGLADSRLHDVGRAVRWIRDNPADSVSVAELARMAGMSESAFHRTFRTVTGMSPIRFQKQLRLQEARVILAGRAGDVTGVAHAVGYQSASQFSREYRRQYGVPPSAHVGDAGAARANA